MGKNIREEMFNLQGKPVLVILKDEEKDIFLADIVKVDKINDTVIFDIIGAPGEGKRERWAMNEVKDVVLVEEMELAD
ncbi:MAG: hypothetical protein COX44_01035 [Candidatus Portnoybacteria bacterium CG23_combo_of_CG06-09_8_20_14_all_37_13]|uniref:Uncharacterized protein n=1 Tax=Candidatus Portnoybacteria bacterium CG23_combo_of_CG06-09_8_20_14_all_37_13 TaxID=1974819 RepID=A0A2G9YET7_9BACT|nr:MAG: hypothetical protein COX44_01035 [Candidatus Portnoybacteria bacterium CG23_combo_of_CG06-09_8_20_14_all_37_13]